jgi:hypothetical protein
MIQSLLMLVSDSHPSSNWSVRVQTRHVLHSLKGKIYTLSVAFMKFICFFLMEGYTTNWSQLPRCLTQQCGIGKSLISLPRKQSKIVNAEPGTVPVTGLCSSPVIERVIIKIKA